MRHVVAEQNLPADVRGSGLRRHVKNETAQQHRRVDSVFGAFDMASAGGYRQFLTAHAIGWAHFNATWKDAVRDLLAMNAPDYSAMLTSDLREIEGAVPAQNPPVPVGDKSAAAGIIYVLSGSRLGIAGIGSEPNWGRENRRAQRFLTERHGIDVFRAVAAFMDGDSGAGLDRDAVIQSARDCFEVFGEAAEQVRGRVA